MAPGWDRGSIAAPGWDGRRLGAGSWNELRCSRLKRWEIGGSGLAWEFGGSSLWWKKPIDSKLGQRKLGGSRLRSLVRPQVVRRGSTSRWLHAIPESRGWRELGSFWLRRRELRDSRLKIKFGGSKLKRNKRRLFRPEMRKLGCSRL